MENSFKKALMGRPPIYPTVEKLASKIEEYFEEGCKTTVVDKFGNEIEADAPSITELAVYLGFSGREAFYKQADRGDDFLHTIKTVRSWMAGKFEKNLILGEATSGSIFWLKVNDGWIEEEKKQVKDDDKKKPLFSIGRK